MDSLLSLNQLPFNAGLVKNIFTGYPSIIKVSCAAFGLFLAWQNSNLLNTNPWQEKIDALGWKERLSANPPLPKKTYPIDRQKAQNWINSHPCQIQREAAAKLIENTRHVTQEEFEAKLKDSVEQFNVWLETQPSKDYVLLVSPKEFQKSNRWVAELALSYLKILPKQVLQLRDNFFRNHPLSEDLLEYRKQHPEVNHFVFFDDAAYSCSQSKFATCELNSLDLFNECGRNVFSCSEERQKEILAAEKNFTISAIIPFMRDPTCILPSSNISHACWPKPQVEKHIHVFTCEKLNTVEDFLTAEESESINCRGNRIPIYFDHKIADSVSTCNEIYEKGGIYNGFKCIKDISLWHKVAEVITFFSQ